MSSIFLLFIVGVVDLAGVFFNIRMLLNCFKKTTNHSSLLKLRPFIICQFVYQVTIIGTTTVKAWKGIEAQHEESVCCTLEMLPTSIVLLLSCNLTAIFFISTPGRLSTLSSQKLRPKLLVSATLCVGFVLSGGFWWNSCVLRESVVSQHVLFAIILVPFLLLTLWKSATKDTALNKDTEDNDDLKAYSLRDMVTKEKTLTFTTAWTLLCLVVIIALPWKSLKESDRRSVLFLAAIIINSFVGIVLPLSFADLCLVSSISAEEKNEKKTIIVI